MQFVVIGAGQWAKRVAEAVSAITLVDPSEAWMLDCVSPGRIADCLLSVNNDTLLSDSMLSRFETCLNLHNGRLPEYAGRHVHQWAIRNGETESEATIHYMTAGVDAGDIVATRTFPIRPTDTGLSLFKASFAVGTELMIEAARKLMAGETLPRRPQVGTRRVYRHKDALNGEIDTSMTAQQIVDFVRAGTYFPMRSPSYTPTFNGKPVRKAEAVNAPGPDVVACKHGFVRLS